LKYRVFLASQTILDKRTIKYLLFQLKKRKLTFW